MKRIFVKIFLLFSFLVLFCSVIYSAEDNSRPRLQPSQVSNSQTSQQAPARPILPPVVPGPLPSVSPTLSPNIAIPPITPDAMDVKRINEINANNQLRGHQVNASTLPNLPGLPVLPLSTGVAASVPSAPISQQKIQLIRSLFGTVVDIGLQEDEIIWLNVKNRFSEETVKINVDSKNTRVMQKDAALALKDIKTGDMVRVIFNQAGENIPVNVISIITEEDLEPVTRPK